MTKKLLTAFFVFFLVPAVYGADYGYQSVSYPQQNRQHIGKQIARHAINQIGIPYRFGGATPSGGFDCSGLVQYTHRLAGIRTPRNSITLLRAIKPIPVSQLQPGDLIFYLIRESKVTHVGIYIGNGRFVHAPKPGKNVKTESLHNPFWHNRIVSTGRLY